MSATCTLKIESANLAWARFDASPLQGLEWIAQKDGGFYCFASVDLAWIGGVHLPAAKSVEEAIRATPTARGKRGMGSFAALADAAAATVLPWPGI